MVSGAAGSSPRALRTTDVARAAGCSVQLVRDLERHGVLPPARRLPNGYRAFGQVHVHALRAYRGVAEAIGPVEARAILADLRARDVTAAAAAVDALHARLAHERDQLLRAQAALRAITAETSANGSEVAGADDDAMTITELAGALGVRSSTLRFWEMEGLVAPERVTRLRVRRYDVAAVRRARVVAALRTAGYGVPVVRDVVASFGAAEVDRTTAAVLQGRLERLAARSVALLRAGTDLAAVVEAARADGAGAAGAGGAGQEVDYGRRMPSPADPPAPAGPARPSRSGR